MKALTSLSLYKDELFSYSIPSQQCSNGRIRSAICWRPFLNAASGFRRSDINILFSVPSYTLILEIDIFCRILITAMYSSHYPIYWFLIFMWCWMLITAVCCTHLPSTWVLILMNCRIILITSANLPFHPVRPSLLTIAIQKSYPCFSDVLWSSFHLRHCTKVCTVQAKPTNLNFNQMWLNKGNYRLTLMTANMMSLTSWRKIIIREIL